MDKYNLIAKTIGAASVGLLAYDSIHRAKRTSGEYQRLSLQTRLPDQFARSIDINSDSHFCNQMKRNLFKWQLDSSIPEFFAGIKGAVKGFCSSIVNNALPLALGIGALFGKGAVGKVCAAGLAAFGAKQVAYDVFGIGRKDTTY